MRQPHKHKKCIIAWANGHQIEYRCTAGGVPCDWRFIVRTPTWDEKAEYRVYDKWRVVKEAFRDGARCEVKTHAGDWTTIAPLSDPDNWNENFEYRIAAPVIIEHFVNVSRSGLVLAASLVTANLKLTFEDDKLTKSEVL